MDAIRDKREIKEAIDACDRVITDIDQALGDLSSASKWSFVDMLGGEFLSSYAKRNKIKSANKKIGSIKKSLKHLEKELSDIGMGLSGEISDTFSDKFFDMFFDNIFTDLRVRGEIKGKMKELEKLRAQVLDIEKNLRKKFF